MSARIIVLALLLTGGLAAPAAADPLTTDLALARATLPGGHPCRAHIDVVMATGLTAADGRPAVELAPLGRRDANGTWDVPCIIGLDSTAWATLTACQRRRVLLHAVGHLGGLHDGADGVMATTVAEQDRVSVPGCPGEREPLRERVTDRVLAMAPPDWEVTCGDRRGLVVRCRAENGRRVRHYRARLWDRAGTDFMVVRVGGGR